MFTITVKPDNGSEFTVKTGARDILKWEKTTRGASLGDITSGSLRLTDLYKIAHIAAQRQGCFHGSLDDFETNCELDFEEEPEPDPTRPAR